MSKYHVTKGFVLKESRNWGNIVFKVLCSFNVLCYYSDNSSRFLEKNNFSSMFELELDGMNNFQQFHHFQIAEKWKKTGKKTISS